MNSFLRPLTRIVIPGLFEPYRGPHKSRGTMPNFLVIGAAKSGTTSLHYYLDQHPEIYMSPVKEPNFFAFERGRPKFGGPSLKQLHGGFWRGHQLRNAKYELSITELRDYQRLFTWAREERALGESSVSYMFFPEAPIRIKDHLPRVRLIAILRHPADRAYSKFMQFQRDGLEPIGDFVKALEEEDNRILEHWSPTWYYKHRGFYYNQLKRYYDIFDPNQIRVFLYDDFRATPLEVLRDIFRFLEVDDRFTPNTSQEHNVSSGPVVVIKSRLLDLLLNTSNPVRSAVNRLFSPHLALKLRMSLLSIASREVKTRQHEPMPQLIRGRLIDEYRPDILQLQELIDKDLSHWLQ
jgi:hypothetical protein